MLLCALTLLLAAHPAPARSPATYWPGAVWERRTPAEVGLDAGRLDEAIAFAKASETKESRDLARAHDMGAFGREPYSNATGPFKTRGDLTGIVLRHGYLVAEWGEPERVDMTFSETKSFLSSVVGLAVDRKMIASVDDRVADAMAPTF
ncbi:MAG TPA: serine hydrolase, partial [Vicinamibacteria bacterium]|nr:serine hydrolase [Vicinamibacteria bacterium]